jgi:hypothetical protein
MNWIAGAAEWPRFKYEVQAQWKQLTAEQLDAIAGVRARLGEQIRCSYGVAPEEAERQICYFEARNEYFRADSAR